MPGEPVLLLQENQSVLGGMPQPEGIVALSRGRLRLQTNFNLRGLLGTIVQN